MNTYIIDNGGAYSDHQIWFVTTDYPISVVEKCIAIASDQYMTHYLVAVVSDVSWRGDARRASLGQYVSDGLYGCGEASMEGNTLPAKLREEASVDYFGWPPFAGPAPERKIERDIP